MSRVVHLLRRARDSRVEIGEIVADALGAASILGLLVILCFVGEIFR